MILQISWNYNVPRSNSAVKLVWGCPIWTRTYILHNLLNCGQSSARVDIIGRYGSFYKGLRDSASHEVRVVSRYVARDVRTTTGKNLGLLRSLTGLNLHSVSTSSLKSALEESLLVPVPEQDAWRIEYLCKLITDRRTAKAAGNQTDEQRHTELINSLVKNWLNLCIYVKFYLLYNCEVFIAKINNDDD